MQTISISEINSGNDIASHGPNIHHFVPKWIKDLPDSQCESS